MPLARLPSYLQRVCFVLVAIIAQHQMVSPCASCRLLVHACSPSMLCGRECRSAPKTGTFFVLGVRWVRDVQCESNWLSTICRRLKGHGAGGLSGRSRGPFGLRVDFQCDSWSLNPAGYGRLTPGLSWCTSKGLFFTFCCLLPEGLNQLLFWCTKTTLLLRNLFKSFPHYRWKLFLLSLVSPRCLRFL